MLPTARTLLPTHHTEALTRMLAPLTRPSPQVYPTRPPKVALHCLSLGVRPGERFGFLGANGAGGGRGRHRGVGRTPTAVPALCYGARIGP